MKENITLALSRSDVETLAVFTEGMLNNCPPTREGYLHQVVIAKLLEKKLHKYRYSSKKAYTVGLNFAEALAWNIESRRYDLSNAGPLVMAVLVDIMDKIEREICNRMARLSPQNHPYPASTKPAAKVLLVESLQEEE